MDALPPDFSAPRPTLRIGIVALLALVLMGGMLAASTGCTGEPPEVGELPETARGHCVYINQFSSTEECREYLGEGWSEDDAREDCLDESGSFVWDEPCSYESSIGFCVQNPGTDTVFRILFPGDDGEMCDLMQRGCEVFAGGVFVADIPCGGTGQIPGGGYNNGGGGIGTGGSVFIPPVETCQEPIDGEPPGQSDGQVCTRDMISACTEEGRAFADYASCDSVFTQRPYWEAPPNTLASDDDPRLDDHAYMAEVDWVKSQVASCGCVCCHSEGLAPEGPSNWYIEAGPIWTDSFYPSGLAMAAGWVDSSPLGAYPAAENHGFDRSVSGFPSTNPERMIAFFEGELTRRGFAREDFAGFLPFGGPLWDQMIYEPEDCDRGEGVSREGVVQWRGGGARYVYILEENSANPAVPPNLDLPAGTIWRLDVEHSAEPIDAGIDYGATPGQSWQAYPVDGSPAALSAGERYYIYVLADVGIPITRCLFEY